jgi:hypothetical protein
MARKLHVCPELVASGTSELPTIHGSERMAETHTDPGGARRTYGGVYNDPEAARRAITRFLESGYPAESLGVLARDQEQAERLAESTGAKVAGGALTGAAAGGMLGGLTGLLLGAGALAIPGIGPVAAGGALAAAFGLAGGTAVAGASIGASVGGLAGALVGLGFDQQEADYYDRAVREGRTLVTVHDDEGRAERLFDETGAERYRRGASAAGKTPPPPII